MKYGIIAMLINGVSLWAANSISLSPMEIPYPTIENLSIEIPISGDDNENAEALVEYRVKGTATWMQAQPLRRVIAGSNWGHTWGEKLSGSIFRLQPETTYEIKVEVSDPDGGGQTLLSEGTTRPTAEIPDNADVEILTPGDYGVWSPASGTPSRPKVYLGQGQVTYDYINLQGAHDIVIMGVKVLSSGDNNVNSIKMNNSSNIVIRFCEIRGTFGIVAYSNGTSNSYIGDNVIIGTTGWTAESMGAQGDNIGEGVQITGPGNVIAYNRIEGFRDGISLMEDSEAKNQVSIDIYGNDINIGADDGIEADFCHGNCRVYDNQINNSYVGLSSQPSLGGPTYFIRNVMYNVVHGAYKLKRGSEGDVVLHNTVVKIGAGMAGNSEMDNALFRNNLAFGGPNGGVNWGGYGAGNPYAADIRNPGSRSSFDYDAVGVGSGTYVAKIGGLDFEDVEPNGYGDIDFNQTFAQAIYPSSPIPEKVMNDLRLNAQSELIDAAILLHNINDDFLGAGPDIGALESGRPLPHYGPRQEGQNESNFPSDGPVSLQEQALNSKRLLDLSEAPGGQNLKNMSDQIIEIELFNSLGQSQAQIHLAPSESYFVPRGQWVKGL